METLTSKYENGCLSTVGGQEIILGCLQPVTAPYKIYLCIFAISIVQYKFRHVDEMIASAWLYESMINL